MLVGCIGELLQSLPYVFLFLVIAYLLCMINFQEILLFWVAVDRAFHTRESSTLGLEPTEVAKWLLFMSASFCYAFVGVIDVVTF